LYVFGASVKNKMCIAVWIHIQILYCVPLVFIFVFVPVPCCFYCYGSLIEFEVRYCDTSSIVLFTELLPWLFTVSCVSK
jgi:hypothetical protein